MTRDEILAKWEAMTPRERDAWVAETVMGYEMSKMWPGCVKDKERRIAFPIPNFSSDIAAAWEVVEKMRSLGFEVRIHMFSEMVYVTIYNVDGRIIEVVQSENVTEAICKAALLAVLSG